MPRLNSQIYLGRRDLLVVCWHHIPELIALLPPAAQWELHRLYAPSHTLTDAEFLAHMKRALIAESSLAQRAGKHYAIIFTTFKIHADVVGKGSWEEIRRRVVRDHPAKNADPTERRQLAIKPLVNPDLDPTKLARVFLHLVDRLSRVDDSEPAAHNQAQ